MIRSWKEMPISVLEQIGEINRLHISNEEKDFQVAALLAGIPYDEFMSMPLSESTDIMRGMAFMYEKPKKVKVQKEYHIGSRDYYLNKANDMTVAQYIDWQQLFSLGLSDHIAELMALVLIPKGKRYNTDYDKEEITEEIRSNFNVEDASSVSDFFIRRFAKSIRQMSILLEAAATAARVTAKKESKEQMRALETQVKAITREFRSAFG